MKVGILTFHCATNYGAILQAYALKEVLCRIGYDAHIIDYRPSYLTNFYNPLSYRPGFSGLVNAAGWIEWFYFIKICIRKIIRNRKFRAFALGYLSLDRTAISCVADNYDIIICGSDQIWNPYLTGKRLDEIFFGLLPNARKAKVISYAASVSDIENLKGHEVEFTAYLRNLSVISTREKKLAEYISALDSNFSPTTVVDPTILAGREIFDAISSDESQIESPYLLYFSLWNNSKLRQYAQTIAVEKKLKFIELTTYYEHVSGCKIYQPASPMEFCSLFKHAHYVVCSSFHGMVFSILFKKQFVVYTDTDHVRFVNLLEDLGLTDRLVYSYTNFEKFHNLLMAAIDYSIIDVKIANLRKQSLIWLQNALKQ